VWGAVGPIPRSTGPLPDSVDFPLVRREEPDSFKLLLFGDTQPRDVKEVDYITRDVIEPLLLQENHGAVLGMTLGDVVFNDLSVFPPLKQAVALLGLPWYNVLGNHDMNFDAVDDRHSDETWEHYFGPPYYSFDHGPVHFIVLDDVVLLLGVDNVKATKRFYLDHGLTVAKSFGSKYVEFATPEAGIKLALYGRRFAAKDAGVSPEGSGSHRLAIINDDATFTDPDGFTWEKA